MKNENKDNLWKWWERVQPFKNKAPTLISSGNLLEELVILWHTNQKSKLI